MLRIGAETCDDACHFYNLPVTLQVGQRGERFRSPHMEGKFGEAIGLPASPVDLRSVPPNVVTNRRHVFTPSSGTGDRLKPIDGVCGIAVSRTTLSWLVTALRPREKPRLSEVAEDRRRDSVLKSDRLEISARDPGVSIVIVHASIVAPRRFDNRRYPGRLIRLRTVSRLAHFRKPMDARGTVLIPMVSSRTCVGTLSKSKSHDLTCRVNKRQASDTC